MNATVLYRIASFLLLVAAAGNTYGALNFWRVAAPMPPVRFPVGHASLSYAQVIMGLDLFCSLCVLFAAYLAWHLGSLARTTPRAIGALGWLLFTYQLGTVYISFHYLSGLVFMLFVILAGCLGWAAWLATRSRPSPSANAGTLPSPA